MSFQTMTWAVEQTTGSPTRKAVLLALANDANTKTGLCCPDIPTIAASTELSEKTVQRALGDLVTGGFIKRNRKRRDDGTLSRYFYTFVQGTQTTPPLDSVSIDHRSESPDKNLERSSNQEVEPIAAAPQERFTKAERDLVWDALVEACGKPMTASETTDFAKTVTELRRVIPRDATSEQVQQAIVVRLQRWWFLHPGVVFNHRTLRNHWTELGRGRSQQDTRPPDVELEDGRF